MVAVARATAFDTTGATLDLRRTVASWNAVEAGAVFGNSSGNCLGIRNERFEVQIGVVVTDCMVVWIECNSSSTSEQGRLQVCQYLHLQMSWASGFRLPLPQSSPPQLR